MRRPSWGAVCAGLLLGSNTLTPFACVRAYAYPCGSGLRGIGLGFRIAIAARQRVPWPSWSPGSRRWETSSVPMIRSFLGPGYHTRHTTDSFWGWHGNVFRSGLYWMNGNGKMGDSTSTKQLMSQFMPMPGTAHKGEPMPKIGLTRLSS